MNPSAPATPPALLPASPEQQAILHRIVAQRERLKARHAAMRHMEQHQPNSEARLAVPEPFAVRLLTFARLHPLFTAAMVAAALAAGPARLNRLGNTILPWLGRLR